MSCWRRSWRVSNLSRSLSSCPKHKAVLKPASHVRQYAAVNASELTFGQPLHETHPHLLKASELTPGIQALEYAQRRSNLVAALPKNSVAIVASADVQYRSGNVFYEFQQHPDFFYLTGFNEPESLAVIAKDSDNEAVFHLFCREKDAKAETWEGPRSGLQAALDVFNADEARDISKLKHYLEPLVEEASYIYTDLTLGSPNTSAFSRFLYGASSNTGKSTSDLSSMLPLRKTKTLRPLMNDLRAFKSKAEVANMRTAGRLSGRAFTNTMQLCFHPDSPINTEEAAIDAYLEYQIKMQGCQSLAFEPVVAGGVNANSIHYVRNDGLLHPDQMVLVDCGGEYGGYVSDITRTFPVNGKFNDAQKDLYQAVLDVQRSCIHLCRESAQMSLDKLHEVAENGLRNNLKSIGFDMSGSKPIETLFPHHLGHYVGLDVHDTVGYSRKAILKANQCITIEPGVYIGEDERWPNYFWNTGIRIEDSVCIGEDNPLVLTAEAVKEVVDIEALKG